MQKDDQERVGVIGLGIIGSRVAGLLRETDRHVYVWNRTPKPVPNFLSSPAEVAKLADVIHIFVVDGKALVEVVDQMKDELSKRHTILCNSTADPQSVVEAYQIAKDAGASFLDLPFTGSKLAAEKGALTYYAGGDPAVVDRVRTILEISARQILYCGRVGEASILKIATNMISATTMEILAEAYGLVSAAGIDPHKLSEALELNAGHSPLIAAKLASVMEGDYAPHFSLKNMFKDAQYGLGLGKSLGLELPALSTTASLMFRAMQKGKGEQDFSVLAERFQKNGNKEEDEKK
ncbi:MAG: NAD(P)-dependent oxidoreductase [Verrucomicrobiales bacterium]|nr:NAD(P)-dependent oxidoreductase [Verrucomicrobiales bacterium]